MPVARPNWGEAAERLFDVEGSGHHQVCQLVDADDEVRHLLSGAWAAVVGSDIANPGLFQQLVAAHHLLDRALEQADDLVRIHDDGRQEVWDAVVGRELHALGVHEEHSDLGRVLVADDG